MRLKHRKKWLFLLIGSFLLQIGLVACAALSRLEVLLLPAWFFYAFLGAGALLIPLEALALNHLFRVFEDGEGRKKRIEVEVVSAGRGGKEEPAPLIAPGSAEPGAFDVPHEDPAPVLVPLPPEVPLDRISGTENGARYAPPK